MSLDYNIGERMAELIRKADAAQKRGDYKTAREYDRQLECLRELNFQMMKAIIEEQEKRKKM